MVPAWLYLRDNSVFNGNTVACAWTYTLAAEYSSRFTLIYTHRGLYSVESP